MANDVIEKEIFTNIKNSSTLTIIGLSILGANELQKDVKESIDKNKLKKFCVIAESDNQLFQHSLITDVAHENGERISFEELKIRRNYFYNQFKNIMNHESKMDYKISSLNIPFLCDITDSNIWYALATNLQIESYIKLDMNNPLYETVQKYTDMLTDKDRGGKYTEEADVEMLELFDQDQIPRGIFPRRSFYNTDHYQYVIWGLVFNREGKLLIHKRADNAKDNQSMWDKSIGGHIDFKRERSTQNAAVRELIEELYTKEKKHQSGPSFSMLSENLEKVYFLGDWRIEKIGPNYLKHIELLEGSKEEGEENWFFYKIPHSFTHNTPRILPNNGGESRLRVIVDCFIFITNTVVDDNYLTNFKNSKYRLVEPSTLKTWMDEKKDDGGKKFIGTPDLKYIMSGKLRNIIDEVSLTIKYSDIRKVQCKR